MQEKQKVTLYLPPELHRKLKIQAAVVDEPMSALAQKAIDFYLTHSDLVEQGDVHGQTHQIHHCPACDSAVVMREGALVGVGSQPTVLPDIAEDLLLPNACGAESTDPGEAELVPC